MISTIFFDDGGVLNDNSRRGPEWKKYIVEYFQPKFGGTAKDWIASNEKVLIELIGIRKEIDQYNSGRIEDAFFESEDYNWLKIMFDYIGIDLPENPIKLSRDARYWITKHVDSAYPGITDVVHELGKNYTLYTASNEVSFELKGYLDGMGISQYFKGFYGSDLLNAIKPSDYFFKELVNQTGVDPSQCILIDDKSKHLDIAKSFGFHTIHSGFEGESPSDHPYFNKSHQLLEIVKNIDANHLDH